ncbi:MAG: hypothetical protein Tsb009_15240 [Planctomycetaceae bacterium]
MLRRKAAENALLGKPDSATRRIKNTLLSKSAVAHAAPTQSRLFEIDLASGQCKQSFIFF